MKKNILIITLSIFCYTAYSQTQFLTSGKIEYERKIDTHRQYDLSTASSFTKDYISKLPLFNTTYFSLYFTGNKTWYTPGNESSDDNQANIAWIIGPAKDNIVLTDLATHEVKSRKNIFEETFILQDSTRHVDWRITGETRTIAGFECRKAVGIIFDSVYVVAFYTDEIMVSGGPESFNGLPGMILGLAIPRLYTTWFATKVELTTPNEKDFKVPSKGKKVNRQSLLATLQGSALKNWNESGERFIWWTLL